jgi:hypothetical protein
MRNKRDKFYKVHGWTLTQMQMPTFLLRRLHLGPAIATLLPFVCHFPPPHGIVRATSLDSDSLHPEGYCLLFEAALIITRSEEDVILILFQEPIFG